MAVTPTPVPTPETKTFEDVKNALFKTAHNLLNLKVSTIVGEAAIKIVNDRIVIDTVENVAASMTTNMNLIEGDIWTVIGKGMVVGDYGDVKAYHSGMVQRAEAIVSGNLEVVSTIITKISEMTRNPAQ